MKLPVGTLRRSSNFHTGQLPPVGMRALTPETPETSSGSAMGTLLHKQAGLDRDDMHCTFSHYRELFPTGFCHTEVFNGNGIRGYPYFGPFRIYRSISVTL